MKDLVEVNSDANSHDSGTPSSTPTGSRETTADETGGSQRSPDSGDINFDTIKSQLTKKDTAAINRLRMIFLLIKLAVAGIVAYIIYRITTQAQNDDYEMGYEAASEKIMTSFLTVIDSAGSMVSLSKASTFYGLDQTNERWPFVTLSNYQSRAATVRTLTGALYISMLYHVTDEDRIEWEQYTQGPKREWIDEGLEFNTKMGYDSFLLQNESSFPNVSTISYMNGDDEIVSDPGPGPYLPRWQFSPAVSSQVINQNLFRKNGSSEFLTKCIQEKHAIFRGFEYGPPGPMNSLNDTTSFFATLRSIKEGKDWYYLGDPMARLYMPVFDSFETTANQTVVAILASVVHWRSYFRNLLPKNVNGIDVVLANSCDGNYTYRINGTEAYIVGFGDHHDDRFDAYVKNATLAGITDINDGTFDLMAISDSGCSYSIAVYPSSDYWESTHSNQPVVLTVFMALVIVFTIVMFLVYDRLVEKRQRYVLSKAAQSTAIVSSLFPKQVRDKMMEMQEEKMKSGTSNKLKAFMSSNLVGANAVMESQIADLFPSCTVVFADIAGFTAWSSTREPNNVFVLLQTVFSTFDHIAKRRKVFKVETIGDCYMAVTGLPEPQPNHAVLMARFAWECRMEMPQMMRQLETRLGPDCSELVLRFGMHSGPVTAGVLKGERARFQLFGDTVNTAARMESTGLRDKIQISQSTADLLIAAGKPHWIKPRDNKIEAKGKGTMQTYWLGLGRSKASSSAGGASDSGGSSLSVSVRDEIQTKQDRLVDWIVEILVSRITPMLAQRRMNNATSSKSSLVSYEPPPGTTCLDEVKEVISIAEYASTKQGGEQSIELNDLISLDILQDFRCYVKMIAQMYRGNPFHNFEHACHVTMSVNKLLQRIIAPDAIQDDEESSSTNGDINHDIQLHAYTHGLCFDYMASFAIVFSALIHDVDHRGCSNMQLIQEEESLAMKYRGKSVAEQNSIDLAWNLLMDDRFEQLRSVLFGNQAELMRFRQFIVNSVLATDIFDKELNDLRKNRWTKAFSEDPSNYDADHSNRRATIVLEHIIQASDVSHTMQHWHIYRKWNCLLFKEMSVAFQQGRMKADPATFWYEGELGFFDNYVIPLAKKLKDCNVFGVSSDEYLNYAVDNRAEWASKGQDIVAGMIQECIGLK